MRRRLRVPLFFNWFGDNMSKISVTFLVVGIAMLTGCGTSIFTQKRDLESSSLQSGLTVTCSGFQSWPDCYRKAATLCPNGHEEISKEESLITQTRAMRINCK